MLGRLWTQVTSVHHEYGRLTLATAGLLLCKVTRKLWMDFDLRGWAWPKKELVRFWWFSFYWCIVDFCTWSGTSANHASYHIISYSEMGMWCAVICWRGIPHHWHHQQQQLKALVAGSRRSPLPNFALLCPVVLKASLTQPASSVQDIHSTSHFSFILYVCSFHGCKTQIFFRKPQPSGFYWVLHFFG